MSKFCTNRVAGNVVPAHRSRWCVGVALLAATSMAAHAEQIAIVGSSTVYPFTTVVAELFGEATGKSTPKVESTGTGGGMKLLCAGIGEQHADIANASRAIKASEIELCAANGISPPLEVGIGFDGIVLARTSATEPMALTLEQVFLALARHLPDASGQLQENPHTNWADIDPSLPDIAIQVYGPPPTSGTRDAFVELAMEKGCEVVPYMQELEQETHKIVCASIREDGAFIEVGENDNLIIQRLVANPNTVGIFGYSFLEENSDRVTGVAIDGVEPEFEAIEDNTYPLARKLYIYVKTEQAAHKPSLLDFVNFYVDEDAIGPDGYLSDRGLVTLPEAEREQVRTAVSGNS